MSIKKIFILTNKKIEGIEEEKERVERLLKKCGKSVQNSPEGVDLIITMGGDGTFLKGVHLIKNPETLIYGIKYGNVGFLANSVENLDKKIKKIVEGDFKPCKRMLMDITVKKGGKAIRDFCLNEAVIFRKGIRIINMDVTGRKETIFEKIRGDGLIISTPIGSTAHSLSALGPVVVPDIECMLIIPVCPHTVSWRPVVVPPDENLTVSISPEASLVIDGQRELELNEADTITVKKSSKTVRIIMDDRAFFKRLRSKFNWGM
jgi:NAD+ kinase